MSHNIIIKSAAGAVLVASLAGAYYVGSKHPAPAPKVITVEKPVIVEKRVEVPVPAPAAKSTATTPTATPTPVPTTKSTVAK